MSIALDGQRDGQLTYELHKVPENNLAPAQHFHSFTFKQLQEKWKSFAAMTEAELLETIWGERISPDDVKDIQAEQETRDELRIRQ